MTTTEILVIVCGGALGYWLVAVLWPLLRNRGDASTTPSLFDSEPEWHQILGVDRDASRDAIEAAYRAKRAEHLPETVAHLGAEARSRAQRRIAQLDRAYAAALQEM